MAEAVAEADSQGQVEYWCHHCDKRVSVESVGDDDVPDLICSDCKFGFVESIGTPAPAPVVIDNDDDDDDIDQPTLGSQFLQVLRLLAQVSNDDNPQPPLLPQPPQLPSSDPNDLLRIQIDHLIQDDDNDDDDVDDDDDDDESVRSVEIEGGDSDTDEEHEQEHEDEEDVIRRQRRDLLRLRLRDFATRARTGGGRNRILDWADILMGLDNYSNSNFRERDSYVGNPGDYVNDADYESLLQNLADSEGRRGAPPASKAAVDGLKSLHINDEQASFVCAVCKECVSVGEVVKEMPCAHAYHTHCILPWLAARNTCPVCRFELPTDDPDYDHHKTTITTTTTSTTSSSANSSSSAATF
ncbi:E3 ubiquitin-protein ligase CIP8-like [Silene latifolia]|uniref:E3 ubiquitin-protein ligase CIP8-like n=1 Tax=Silene latifolia TaxID=37657 RepID=UPI003D780535